MSTERPSERATREVERLSTGVPGLDKVLYGGLPPGRAYLVRGGPGSGKTVLGLHFLIAGAQQGEPVLFVSFSEPADEIRHNAESMGLDLSGVSFLDLAPSSEFFAEGQTYDIFSPAEVEREPTARRLIDTVEELQPQRVFLDAVTHLRYLATGKQQFLRYVLSFLRYLVETGATVLFSSEFSPLAPDEDLQFLSDGILQLENNTTGRRLRVLKLRGSGFRAGYHSVKIGHGGMRVFPRMVPEAHHLQFTEEAIPSGINELDAMLHGGLERGTVTLITGPVGTGKTTLGLQFAREAAQRGERSVVYLFEEAVESVIRRSESISIPVTKMVEQGTLSLVYLEPLQMSAAEFGDRVRREVEQEGARIVMIDSIAGYMLALQGEDVVENLHALTRYLRNMGITALFVNEVESITGPFKASEQGISYLADNLLFLRYLEIEGELRKAIGVLKKRLSGFERTLRELEITPQGLRLGEPLTRLRGILSGTPEWVRIDGQEQGE